MRESTSKCPPVGRFLSFPVYLKSLFKDTLALPPAANLGIPPPDDLLIESKVETPPGI